MARRAKKSSGKRKRVLDPVRLDVFNHLFAAAAEEMGAVLLRSSLSPNIRERRDFSCALFDGEGRMIGQAAHLPIHLGSTPMSVRAAIDTIDMEPGDAVCLNDPYAGGTHLPDITLVSPVFLEGSTRADFYCANRAHHADVGGSEPGSMAAVGDVHGEGLRIPPVRLVRAGEVDREMLSLFLANMRVPHERQGDLLAQWSTNRIGAKRLVDLATEYGLDELRTRAGELMDWTERLTRELLRSLPDRTVRFEDQLETPAGDAVWIRVTLAKNGERLLCDFRETDAAPESSLNATRAVALSAIFYVLRTLLPEFTPTNDGILRPVEVLTRKGTVCDATYPSGVAAGNVETSQRLVDTLLGAFAELCGERIPAASAGTMSNLTFGGPLGASSSTREPYAYYETSPGGAGASLQGPGAHVVQTHMTNTRNTPVEELELSYPVRLLSLEARRNSGGKGQHRGGDGLTKRLVFLEPAHASFVGQRQRKGPWGLAGGAPGRPGVLSRERAGKRETLPGNWSGRVEAGTLLRVDTPGGGGYGRG